MNGLPLAQERMRRAGMPAAAIDVFSQAYEHLDTGATGMIAESDIEPLDDVLHAGQLDIGEEDQHQAASRTAVIKLNGGLGTSMGMHQAKSLLPVRGEQTFLDLIVEQIRSVRQQLDVAMPLLLMNSFRTRDDTLAALHAHRDISVEGLPLDFLQHQEPKLRADSLTPIDWPADPSLEWCPPGHGDLYTALWTSGVLGKLVEAGYRYASVSNADNLGAAPDPAMMGWFAASGAPYAAEVCRRTPADVKGGHLVVRPSDGRLVLRETAQTRDEDAAAAADPNRHRFFHTNNLWLDLRALDRVLRERAGVLGLPLIRNVKNVDPTDQESPEVIQIESAMGAAVEVFDGATAIEVDRSRFLPVKTTNDLLLLRSDVYRLDSHQRLRAQADPVPLVALDPDFYTNIVEFSARFDAPPSLIDAASFTVEGDWRFEEGVGVRGHAKLAQPVGGVQQTVTAGTVLGEQ